MRRFTPFQKGAAAPVVLAVSITAAGLVIPSIAEAYTPTLSPSGLQVRLTGARKLNLAGNPSNKSGISADAFRGAVVRGLQRWKAASGAAVGFDYWQGSDGRTYEANSEYNGLSSVYFASQGDSSQLDSGVIGLTQVWYDTETGEILETDIVLNDINYRFTTETSDTTGYGKGTYDYDSRVFIENVVTHELGHAFGLSHTGIMQGSMLFLESPEQAHLSCDDIAGIRSVYPQGSVPKSGSISGRVTSPGGSGVFGAHVVAVSARRGAVLASAVTDRSGSYRVGGLEPGDYHLIVEPYYAGASALPAYYSEADPFVCSGAPFGRTFLKDGGGFQLRRVNVKAGGNASAPSIRVACSGGADLAGTRGGESVDSAPTVVTGNGTRGVVDRASTGAFSFYRFASVSGKLEVRVLSHSLYSPVRVFATLVDSSGREIESKQASPVFTGASGYRNFDTVIVAEDLPAGDYYLKMSAAHLSSLYYPAGMVAMDSVPFVVITASVNASQPPHADVTPFNARCQKADAFAAYVSPGGNPLRQDTDGGGVGFCGSVAAAAAGALSGKGPRIGGGDDDHGPSAGAVAGWFVPWVFMFFAARLARMGRRRPRSVALCPARS